MPSFFHSPYPPAAGAVYAAAHAVRAVAGHLLALALSPVDRVLQIVGDHASQSTYDQVRHQLGLDHPLPVQFWHYLVNLAHGDLGIASATGQPVLHDLLAVFPATLELATLALIVGAVLGIVAGVLCARYAGSPWDLAVRTFTLLGNSVPIFWLGLLMLAPVLRPAAVGARPGSPRRYLSVHRRATQRFCADRHLALRRYRGV